MTSVRGALGCALAAAAAILASPAAAADFPVAPDTKAVGQVQTYTVQPGDNFADIARKFDIGYTEMVAANPGVAPWTPPVGKTLTIPSLYILPDRPRRGIVLNLGERRLYYFQRDGEMQTYPIGIGAIGFDTPHSTTTVVRKEPNPVWVPPPSIRAEQPDLPAMIGPGPDDPLGDYALRLGWKNYLIHGTNKPDGVGRNVSHGCIHLYPEDIEKLFNSVAVGTPVRVIDQPAAAAWIQNRLYVEVHPSKDQADEIDTEQPMTADPPAGLRQIVSAAAGDFAPAVDWRAVDREGLRRTGRPTEVAVGAPGGAITGAPMVSNALPASPQAGTWAPPEEEAASAPSLTPIFNTLRPPGAAAAGQGPRDLVGDTLALRPAFAPPPAGYNGATAPPPVPADQDVHDLDDLRAAPAHGAAPGPGPEDANEAYDPNAAYNAQYNDQGDPDRSAWDRGFRR